eukprot:3072065-Prymnesium_polylepis.1
MVTTTYAVTAYNSDGSAFQQQRQATVAAVNGSANFSGLVITHAAAHRLVLSVAGLSQAVGAFVTPPIVVRHAAPAALHVLHHP